MSTMTNPRIIQRWSHFAYGSSRVAWCNECDEAIVSFVLGAGTEGLPPAVRRKIDAHLADHDRQASP